MATMASKAIKMAYPILLSLEKVLNFAPYFFRVKVYLCFYCRFEDEQKPAMREHFRKAHDMRVHVEDDQEGDGDR